MIQITYPKAIKNDSFLKHLLTNTERKVRGCPSLRAMKYIDLESAEFFIR